MADRNPITSRSNSRSAYVPENDPEWVRGQALIGAQKRRQDIYDYVLAQTGSPEQAERLADRAMRTMGRQEITGAISGAGPLLARGAEGAINLASRIMGKAPVFTRPLEGQVLSPLLGGGRNSRTADEMLELSAPPTRPAIQYQPRDPVGTPSRTRDMTSEGGVDPESILQARRIREGEAATDRVLQSTRFEGEGGSTADVIQAAKNVHNRRIAAEQARRDMELARFMDEGGGMANTRVPPSFSREFTLGETVPSTQGIPKGRPYSDYGPLATTSQARSVVGEGLPSSLMPLFAKYGTGVAGVVPAIEMARGANNYGIQPSERAIAETNAPVAPREDRENVSEYVSTAPYEERLIAAQRALDRGYPASEVNAYFGTNLSDINPEKGQRTETPVQDVRQEDSGSSFEDAARSRADAAFTARQTQYFLDKGYSPEDAARYANESNRSDYISQAKRESLDRVAQNRMQQYYRDNPQRLGDDQPPSQVDQFSETPIGQGEVERGMPRGSYRPKMKLVPYTTETPVPFNPDNPLMLQQPQVQGYSRWEMTPEGEAERADERRNQIDVNREMRATSDRITREVGTQPRAVSPNQSIVDAAIRAINTGPTGFDNQPSPQTAPLTTAPAPTFSQVGGDYNDSFNAPYSAPSAATVPSQSAAPSTARQAPAPARPAPAQAAQVQEAAANPANMTLRKLWDAANASGESRDFFRADQAMQAALKRGEDIGYYVKPETMKAGGSVNGKDAAVHKALEIIQHMITRR